jgi:hypothetical protein
MHVCAGEASFVVGLPPAVVAEALDPELGATTRRQGAGRRGSTRHTRCVSCESGWEEDVCAMRVCLVCTRLADRPPQGSSTRPS